MIGNPLYMSGDLSPQATKAQAFAQMLWEETGLPVHLWDERLTTTEAHGHLHVSGVVGSAHKKMVDQVAAVLILQGYRDAISLRAERKLEEWRPNRPKPDETIAPHQTYPLCPKPCALFLGLADDIRELQPGLAQRQ